MSCTAHGRNHVAGPTRYVELRIAYTEDGAPVSALIRSLNEEYAEREWVRHSHTEVDPIADRLPSILQDLAEWVYAPMEPSLWL